LWVDLGLFIWVILREGVDMTFGGLYARNKPLKSLGGGKGDLSI
jgi:hypothetical protein